MWDVIWTDPDRELVGEHRARKERKRDKAPQQPPSQQQQQQRGSVSGNSADPRQGGGGSGTTASTTAGAPPASARLLRRSSMSISSRSSLSSADSPFAFLKPKALRHLSTSHAAARMKPSSGDAGGSSPALDSRSRRSSGIMPAAGGFDPQLADEARLDRSLVKSVDSGGELSPSCTSRHDSVFSKYPDSDALTSNSVTEGPSTDMGKPPSLVQAISHSSVTKQAEVSPASGSTQRDSQEPAAEPVISPNPKSETSWISPKSPSALPASPTELPVDIVPPLAPPLKSPLRAVSPKYPPSLQHHNPDLWRPPEEWDDAPPPPEDAQTLPAIDSLASQLSSTAVRDEPQQVQTPSAPEFKALRREVERMAAATPAVILSRLQEVWTAAPDSGLREELELEKRRWMLSALHHLDLVPERGALQAPAGKIALADAQTILALYESPSTASYLAALHHTKQLYHMSTQPLSPALYPNTHPLAVPSISPSLFPASPSSFDAAYALSLPSQCAAQDLPALLHRVAASLRPGAALHLTLVDPLPRPATLGRHLRAWLDDHLLLPLERRFRCASPSRLMPAWLGQAGLRGAGSTLTTAKFCAVPESARHGGGGGGGARRSRSRSPDPDPEVRAARRDRETRAELRSLVGRMLWAEVWGGFVEAERWWWEEPRCVEECLELGTFWEYQKIEGVKDWGDA